MSVWRAANASVCNYTLSLLALMNQRVWIAIECDGCVCVCFISPNFVLSLAFPFILQKQRTFFNVIHHKNDNISLKLFFFLVIVEFKIPKSHTFLLHFLCIWACVKLIRWFYEFICDQIEFLFYFFSVSPNICIEFVVAATIVVVS